MKRGSRWWAGVVVAGVLVGVAATPASAQVPADRYALAGGCFTLQPVGGGGNVGRQGDGYGLAAVGEPFRFQASDLGRYLLLDTASRFFAANGAAGDPSPDADWIVEEAAGDGAFTFVPASGGQPRTYVVEPAEGCAAFPDVEINVAGPLVTGATPYEEVRGYLDGHLHMMAFEFLGGRVHCGRPWHPYGVEHALVDCPDHYVANGAGAVVENFLSNGEPVATHDPVGWPTFRAWPAPHSLTHEQVYYRWLERAWRGGLRMMVNLFVDNGVLCEVYPLKQNSCDEMDGVRLQAQRIRELERYIDAQSGGPGEGWFRIVSDPFEARRVINEGRLAVVLGIEVSELFGCSLFLGQPQCTADQIDTQLDEVHALGVRQVELVNKFDNALAGVAGDGGTTGVVVNAGNFYSSGQFWDFRTCEGEAPGAHDHAQHTVPGGSPDQDALFGAVAQFLPGGVAPVYGEEPQCNTRGLSPLGAHAIDGLIARRMLFDPDHMSVRARSQALDLIERRGYSGVLSSHSWSTPDAYPRIYELGGVITPYAGDATGFVEQWRQDREWADDRYVFGIGYGADANGLGAQGEPRGPRAENPVTYPFEGFGGVTIDRQVSGERVYDINVDGVAHYGLYPDWIEDLRHLAGDDIVRDLERGPEAYLQMWERAVGVAGPGCRASAVLAGLEPGLTSEDVLRVVGQPASRHGSTYGYCVTGGGDALVSFDAAGRVAGPATVAVAASAETPGGPASLPATGSRSLIVVAGGLLVIALLLRRAA